MAAAIRISEAVARKLETTCAARVERRSAREENGVFVVAGELGINRARIHKISSVDCAWRITRFESAVIRKGTCKVSVAAENAIHADETIARDKDAAIPRRRMGGAEGEFAVNCEISSDLLSNNSGGRINCA